ncbi:hypothetical protein INT47_005117 [Mucor saturninus]|uniref:Uncharacterized protein n=1 Tax=Mucor saturninus TaxID=64648 RepID=A0A8H7QGM4_9FUNG|nr:hypothetical protein INT47_005117 [Mucor saturninus]
MPPLNARKRAYANKNKNQDGVFMTRSVDVNDWEEMSIDNTTNVDELHSLAESCNATSIVKNSINKILVDITGQSSRPKTYIGTSRTTLWRNRKESNLIDDRSKLTHFGFVPVAVAATQHEVVLSRSQKELIQINEVFLQLQDLLKPIMNKSQENSKVLVYNFVRYSSINCYFIRRLEGMNKGQASRNAARQFWHDNNVAYRAMTIIKWSNEFLQERKLSDHCQGVHSKRKSFLNDSDVKMMILEEMRKTKPAERSLVVIKKFIDDVVVPSFLGVANRSVAETTISKYLYEWGYAYRKNKKMIYFDGHEREDVVAYRDKWSRRMMEYMEKMDFYAGENEENILEPELEDGEKKLVFVTQDESTFYANDGKNDLWLEDGENHIRKKGPGSSIMISEFQCPCHGTMKIENWSSRTKFKAGDSREGWWTYKHMVEQLEENVIGLFDALHPGCKAVFLFDNSSNHGAYSDEALVVNRMALKDRVWPVTSKFQFHDTVITLTNGEVLEQSFFYDKVDTSRDKKGRTKSKTVRYFKGIKTILEERNQWIGHDINRKAWKLDCGSPEVSSDKICCARHFLGSRPDFCNQKSALQEVVEDAGHIFELYPKYHCECNWIEMYWGGAKREARLRCDYTFKSLDSNMDAFLDKAGSIARIRRYFRRATEYIEAYSKCSDGREVVQTVKKFAEKKYLSHRKVRIPSDLDHE